MCAVECSGSDMLARGNCCKLPAAAATARVATAALVKATMLRSRWGGVRKSPWGGHELLVVLMRLHRGPSLSSLVSLKREAPERNVPGLPSI